MEEDLVLPPSTFSYQVASTFDLPLIAIALVLTIIAIVRTREGRLTWLLLALACFTIKEAIYLAPLLTRFDPMNDPPLKRGQVWIGAAG